MAEQIKATIDYWTFEYNPDLSGNVIIGDEFEIPMEVLLSFIIKALSDNFEEAKTVKEIEAVS